MSEPPSPPGNPQTADELIGAYLDAFHLGTAPSPEDFIRAHPAHRAELEEILPLILEMSSLGAELTDMPDPDLPERLPVVAGGDFLLERILGSGGMGTVYAATQLSLNRPCAVKLLTGGLHARQEDRERFRRESKLIARLRHPNIISVHSAGSFGDRCYYAMDLVEGPPLSALCTSARAVARIGRSLAEALAYAHSCGIIHCDVKPSNILTEPDGTVRLGDFGLSHLTDGPQNRETGGTLHYMSPERLRGEPATAASDQYALGVTLRELLSNIPPNGGTPHGSEKKQSVPPDLAAVIDTMTAEEPDRRYPTLLHAADDLRRFSEHRPVSARPASPVRRLLLWSRRRPVSATATLLAVLGTAAAATALIAEYRTAVRERRSAEYAADMTGRTLTRVLSHAAQSLPTKAGTRMLNDLLPYCTELAQRNILSGETLREAYLAIGSAARRSGQPRLALSVLNRLTVLDSSAENENRRAEALYACGEREAGLAADRALYRRHAGAADPRRRLTALTALLRLAEADASCRSGLKPLLDSLYRELPGSDPDLRCQTAMVLLSFPEAVGRDHRPQPNSSATENALSILRTLSRQYDSPRYGTAIVRSAARRLAALPPGTSANPYLTAAALSESGRLLGQNLGDSTVANDVIGFWLEYIRHLRSNGSDALCDAFVNRIYGILDVLYYNSETTDETRSFLLRAVLKKLEAACRADSAADIQSRYGQLKEKLRFARSSEADAIETEAERLMLAHPYTFGDAGIRLRQTVDLSADCSLFAPVLTVAPEKPAPSAASASDDPHAPRRPNTSSALIRLLPARNTKRKTQ